MKKRYVVILTVMLWSAGFVFVLGSAAPVSALQLEWNGYEWIGKTVEASYEHKDRDVSSQTTGIDLSYQGPFYQRCDEEVYGLSNEPVSSITLSEIADLPTIGFVFVLTLTSLEELKAEDIPDKSWIDSLKPLTGQKYELEESFLADVELTIGPALTALYGELILEHARVRQFVLTLTSLEELKAEDIPDKSWIDSLKPLTGQEYEGEESFLAAVELTIGPALTALYGELILEHARIRQADSTATSTVVETSNPDQTQFHFEIDLDDIIGNSYYNATTTDPFRHDEDMLAYSDDPEGFVDEHGTPPPDVECDQNGDCTYYSNWEMTSADSHAYGGYGGTGNTFTIDDGDSTADEQFWVSAVYSYEYSLSGRWTYHTVTNTHQENDDTDNVTYNERTGHFYTSFSPYLYIDVDGFEPPNPLDYKYELSRNDNADILGTEGLERVSQEMSGEFTTTYSFLVTEGVKYSFDMWADVYGYCDGFADYNSFGLVTLDLMVMEDMPHTPEPATILLLVIGIPGLYWYRNRFHKR